MAHLTRLIPGVNDLATVNPALAAEWHPTKNGELTPGMVAACSAKKVWWQCKNGHEWEAKVNNRKNGRNCPFCGNKVVLPGFNDLTTTHSRLTAEWHPTKNGDLTPDMVTAGSDKKVWWRCEHGHEWEALIYNRKKGVGCPYCSKRFSTSGQTDLMTLFPTLAQEWNYEKNAPLTPDTVSPGSNKKVWWKCVNGHEWECSVAYRKSHRNSCPYCSGKFPVLGETDLATVAPLLAAQWHPTKNGDLSPQDVITGSHKKVWWQCDNGHEWKAQVRSRFAGTGCPYCSKRLPVAGETDLATLNPALAKEWDYKKNAPLTPDQVCLRSNKKVWWHCEYGHEWKAKISDRSAGNNCPYCTGSKVLAGYNDLATIYPELAAEWHPTKNGALAPEAVAVSSAKKVWWKCAVGHEWQAVVFSRSGRNFGGSNCPICAKRTPYHKKYTH